MTKNKTEKEGEDRYDRVCKSFRERHPVLDNVLWAITALLAGLYVGMVVFR